jgi:hypothetical protein
MHRGGGRFVNELGGRDYVTGRMLDVAASSPPVTEVDGSDGKLFCIFIYLFIYIYLFNYLLSL